MSNLPLACQPCNQKKGAQPIEAFLKSKPDLLKHIKAQAKRIRALTAAHGSPAEARALAEIADYWASKA